MKVLVSKLTTLIIVLKPVNEYNIVDKIKEANKELFAAEQVTKKSDDLELSQSFDLLNDNSSKKVQFAENLEDYEPPSKENYEYEKSTSVLPAIDELSDDNNSAILEEIEIVEDESTCIEKLNSRKHINENTNDKVDEICEEIVIMDMDSGVKLDKETREINNKPMTVKNEKILQKTEEMYIDDNDEDEDDLSIIVASYISDECTNDDDRTKNNEQENPGKTSLKKTCLSKRFSFRRKHLTKERANENTQCSDNLLETTTDIKFNYRICCDYRNSILPEKLPKYTGYLSEYGLSQAQYEKRELNIKKQQLSVLENTLKVNEHELRKMKDNERAFTKWLKNKMRPINKTKNMFDVKTTTCSNKKTRTNQNQNNHLITQ